MSCRAPSTKLAAIRQEVPRHATWAAPTNTLAVLGVAAVAAVASYEHAYDLVRAHLSGS